MGANSKIEWTHHTFNPWWGCTKVSAGCANCYAEGTARRWGTRWGKYAARRFFEQPYWDAPLKWNSAAKSAGQHRRVFCASMADVFEDMPPNPAIDKARADLWKLIQATPHLDWLLLTKRPQNILSMVPLGWARGGWPLNAWAGTSCENQAEADKRIPELLQLPALIRFLSCEPLLGPLDLKNYLKVAWQCSHCHQYFPNPWQKICPACGLEDYWTGSHRFNRAKQQTGSGISWVIAGGESGQAARVMHPGWAESLRDQCQAAEVPFFFKQWGTYVPAMVYGSDFYTHEGLQLVPYKQTNWHMLPFNGFMAKAGKSKSGRLLDGRTWDEFPTLGVK